MEFYHVKGDLKVPEGGWTLEEFRSSNGVRLLRAIVTVRKAGVARGIRAMTGILQKFFSKQLTEIVNKVERSRGSLSAKAVVTISPTAHEQLWAQVIQDVFATSDILLQLEYEPSIQSVCVEINRKVSLLMGVSADAITEQGIRARVLELAKEVTRINDTTRALLKQVIDTGLRDSLTVREMIDRIKEQVPSIAGNRVVTIARTEMGRAADESSKQAFKDSQVVTHVSVIGCEGVEPGSPTYRGIHTCNIRDVPISDVDQLEFHPNHTGAIVPSRFRRNDGSSESPRTVQGPGPAQGVEGVSYGDERL